MRHIAAYALLVLGGKENPTPADVEKVVKDAGAEPDKEKITALCNALEGKPFNELVSAGIAKLGSMGTGAPAAGGASAAAAAPKEEEKPKEEEPEEDVDIGGMFGDDDDDY